MIDNAYTSRELAEMKLSGWPQTKRNFNAMASRENWSSRPREGRGGGREYLFTGLPLELQKAIIFRHAELNKMPDLKSSLTTLQLDDMRGRAKLTPEERRSAKLTVVALFEKFQKTCGMPVLEAEKAFIAFYQAERSRGDSALFPSWVADICATFSVQSLRRWRAQSRADAKALGGGYGNRKGTSLIARAEGGKMADYIAALLLKQTHLKAGHVRDLCRRQFGNAIRVANKRSGQLEEIAMPKIRAFERHIAAWKSENADLHQRLTNPDAHKNRNQMALGRADAGIDRLNQVWQIDASPADALCSDGRYAVYAIIDIWSRRAMFSVTKTPRTEAALLLIRRAILEWGAPEVIKTDNGSDFVSKRFMMSLLHLGIEQDVCPPYSPEKKPHVERVIHTLQHDLMPVLPGFVGHNVADKQRIRAKETFAKTLGESDKETFAVSLSHGELQARINDWASDSYAHRAHRGLDGESPFAKAARWTAPVRRIENTRALDLLLAAVADGDGFRVVGKKGLRINNGYFYGAGMELHVGERVLVRHDPEDMGRVFVFSEENEFICEAVDYERLGINPVVAAAEAKARQREYYKTATKELRREMNKITPEKISEDLRAQHAADAATLTSFPKQSETYSTPALNEAARAVTQTPAPEMTPDQAQQQQAFVIDFARRQEEAANRPTEQSDNDRRWERAQRLIALEATGATLSQDDADWLAHTRTRPWFRNRQDFEAMKVAAETGG